MGTLTDVSQQQAIDGPARSTAALLESVFSTQVFGVAVLDGQGRVAMANQTFCELLGCSAASVQGLSLELLVEPEPTAEGPADHTPLHSSLRNLQLRSQSGRRIWVLAETRLLPQPIDDAVALLVVQDVTALRESIQQLEREARLDASTGLVNRSYFTETLKREISRCQRQQSQLALAWIDLDHFKAVNDLYGHEAGDRVLQTISSRLEQVVRGQDCVGRLGGDEFGIVVSGYNSIGELESMLKRVMAVLREPIAIANAEFEVGGSVGISLYPDDAAELEGLLNSADAAMYAVKADGGNDFAYFTPQMNAAAEERRRMQQQLGDAIVSGEFELHYQPILAAADGQVWGVEALLRWHRDGASVAAGDFISFAEENGVLRRLSPLILQLLQSDRERLQASGAGGLRVSMNLSVRQLADDQLTAQLSRWSAPCGLPGLVVDVTESVFLPDHAKAMAALQQLGRQGAEISIDDCGTHYSNIRLLKTLQPSYIKLNRGFLDLCSGDTPGGRLLRAATELGHALGALVVIEGIEDAATYDLAVTAGADLLQGYLLAKPMPMAELLAWLEQQEHAPATPQPAGAAMPPPGD